MLRKKSGICIKPNVLYNKKKKKKKKCKRTPLETYGLLGLVFNTTFNKFQWGSVLLVVSVKGRAQRKPRTCHKSLANFIT